MDFLSILTTILLVIHILVCILLIFVVLMQRPKSEGLGTAFGSGMTDTLFGSNAGTVLTKFTTYLAVFFFINTLVLAYLYGHRRSSDLGKRLGSQVTLTETNKAPAAVTTPADGTNAAVTVTLPPVTNQTATATTTITNKVSGAAEKKK
jgi:preprotein translocase subunit SecG